MKVTRSFRIEEGLSAMLDANNKRLGDVTYHVESALRQYFAGMKKPEVKPRSTPVDYEEIEIMFDRFWDSGIRKTGKKQAKQAFIKILKGKVQKQEFTDYLIKDIKWRLSSGQLGFAEMHPTTYLRNERWEDERVQPKPNPIGGSSLDQRSREQTAQIHAMLQAGHFDQCPMGQDGSDISPSLDQGRGGEDAGQCIDAEFSLVVQEDGTFNR